MSYYIFCDVDGTLVKKNTMMSFLSFFIQHQSTGFAKAIAAEFHKLKLNLLRKCKIKREVLNRLYYRIYANIEVDMIRQIALEWYQSQDRHAFYNSQVRDYLQHHLENQGVIVLVSGAFRPVIEHIAADVFAKHIICTEAEVKHLRYTGNIVGYPVIGKEKGVQIMNYKNNKGIDLECCHALGDHFSDLSMLDLVGNPVVVNNDPTLLQYAKENHWKIIE